MDFDPREFLADFLVEAGEHLTTLDDGMLQAERLVAEGRAMDDALVNELFRAIHTLKGMAGMMGFNTLQGLSHNMEAVFDQVRAGTRQLVPLEVEVLFAGLDAIKRQHASVEATGEESGEDAGEVLSAIAAMVTRRGTTPGEPEARVLTGDNWLERLDPHDQMATLVEVAKGTQLFCLHVDVRRDCVETGYAEWRGGLDLIGSVLGLWTPDEAPLPAGTEPGGELHVLLMTEADRQSVLDCTGLPPEALRPAPLPWDEPAAEPAPAPAAPARQAAEEEAKPAKAAATAKEKVNSIRVETTRLDQLMEIVGELVIHHTRFVELCGELRDVVEAPEDLDRSRLGALVGALDETLQVTGRINDELQETTMRVRMVPVSSLFNRFPRILRDLAHACGKSARLEVVGGETELDKTVIEQISDPLIHLLRNAADHGLETPERRLEAGKPAEGLVTLAASQHGSHIVIVVSDDGGGIDRAKVLAKARERGLVREGEVPSDHEILQLIFRPGFSTAEAVTSISGRGVGMDVVKSNIERLGGSIQVHSGIGVGTRFVIKLPLTLVIAKALLVKAHGQTFAIPLAFVEETLRLQPHEIKTVHEQAVMHVRDAIVPLFHLSRVLGVPPSEAGAHWPVVVVGDGGARMGLIVDGLVGQQDVVIKPLGDYMGTLPGLGGATILGSGSVALILDIPTLLEQPPRAVATV